MFNRIRIIRGRMMANENELKEKYLKERKFRKAKGFVINKSCRMMEINKIIIEKQDEEYIGQVYEDSVEPLRKFYPNENQLRRLVGSLKYLKIDTLWKREGKDKKGTIRPGDYSKQEFNSIKLYRLTEKVHGENTRVIYDMEDVMFEGRTDNASKIGRASCRERV